MRRRDFIALLSSSAAAPRFVPGFDPLGICKVFRSGTWRGHCAPLSVLVAARAYRRAERGFCAITSRVSAGSA
jgi:hypothetical protein